MARWTRSGGGGGRGCGRVARWRRKGLRCPYFGGGRRLCSGQGDGWRAREEEWDVLGVHGGLGEAK